MRVVLDAAQCRARRHSVVIGHYSTRCGGGWENRASLKRCAIADSGTAERRNEECAPSISQRTEHTQQPVPNQKQRKGKPRSRVTGGCVRGSRWVLCALYAYAPPPE